MSTNSTLIHLSHHSQDIFPKAKVPVTSPHVKTLPRPSCFPTKPGIDSALALKVPRGMSPDYISGLNFNSFSTKVQGALADLDDTVLTLTLTPIPMASLTRPLY